MIINMLIGCGYKKGATTTCQFCRIGKAMDGLRDKLKTAYKGYWEKKALREVSMILSFLTGVEFVEGFESFFFVKRWTMHQLLVECPAIYEMLPNPEFNWRNKPQIQVWRKKQQSEEEERDGCVELDSYGPKESPTLFEEALRHNELKFNGKTIPLPFNFSIIKWAACTRKVIEDAKLLNGVSFHNIYGMSFDIPYDVCYGSESYPIGDFSQLCHSMPHYSFVDGDGTVPAESANVADGFAAVQRAGVVADHRGLLCDKNVFEFLRKWLGVADKVKDYSRCSKVYGC